MQKKVNLATLALFSCTLAMAQNEKTEQHIAQGLDENAFTFSEAQLGEDDDMSSNVTILNSTSNVYASKAGYLFSPVRFRYRAFNQKYNDVYINGTVMNDMETGQFRFSNIGGLNRFSRNVDFSLPFEANNYSMTGMAGSNNYDFRAGSMQEGQYASVAAANRNYTLRGLYTYASGFNEKGWAITALVSLNGKTAGGTTPDTPTAGEAKGDGTAANPFNSVAAQKYTAALEAGVVTDKEFYIKGKVQSVKEQFSAAFGNGSFYIADDANSTQFYIFRIYYFGGEKWKKGDMTLKEGDEIVVCAKLINYMGNTPETNQGGKLISVNGKTSGEGGGTVTPDPEPDPNPGEVATGENGGFETWADGKPTNWNTTSAGNATLTQSEDAHTGKYSVQVAGSPKANKRLGYKEMKLKAGKYTLKFYAKAATATGASVCPGHVAVKDGVVDSQNYVYTKQYVNVSNEKWILIEQEIEIAADGTYSIVIMNAKKPGAAVLIDDFTFSLGSTAIIK